MRQLALPVIFLQLLVDVEQDIFIGSIAAEFVSRTVSIHECLQRIAGETRDPGHIGPGKTEVDIVVDLFLFEPPSQPSSLRLSGGEIVDGTYADAKTIFGCFAADEPATVYRIDPGIFFLSF